MLSSGFGWAYLLKLTADNPVIASPLSAFEALNTAAVKTIDIFVPNTFIDVGHPDITTGLIIIALPAGFVLLGLIKENISGKLKYIALIAPVCILGYLSHDEFGFFIIVASVIPLIFRLNGKNTVFAAILFALFFAILVALLFPGRYYIVRELFGVPYIVLYFLFVPSMWALYASKFLYRLNILTNTLSNIIKRIVRGRQVKLILAIGVVSLVSYLYILSFIIWYFQLPTFDSRLHTNTLMVIPWHFYPLRFGVTGLIGLCFILSYIFKKFEREVFIFGIMAIIAFFTVTQFYEVRSNKYVMASMAGFASLLLYKILSMPKQSLKKHLINGILIGFVITSSSLSGTLMYLGYSVLGLENHNENFNKWDIDIVGDVLPRRYFPSDSEIDLLNFLRNNLNIKTDDSVAMPENEIRIFHGLAPKLEGFVGLAWPKIFQSPMTLQESTIEGFYTLLDYSNSRFIVLQKQYINSILSEIVKFALKNFEKVYEDDKSVILSVPPLAPPSPERGGDVLSYILILQVIWIYRFLQVPF